MSHIELALHDEADTVLLAERLADVLPRTAVVALNGTLGAGKTRLVRAFAVACGLSPSEITSPTFTLWQTYHGTRLIHHLDAYRVRDEDEFLQLGVEEAYQEEAIVFIEWAERVHDVLPPDHLTLTIEVVSASARRVLIETHGPGWEAVLDKLR